MEGFKLLNNLWDYIVNPTLTLIFTAGLLVFLWGLVQFMWHLKDGSGHEEGVQHMVWGMVGMFIMVAVGGITAMIINFTGADPRTPDASRLNNIQTPNIFNTR